MEWEWEVVGEWDRTGGVGDKGDIFICIQSESDISDGAIPLTQLGTDLRTERSNWDSQKSAGVSGVGEVGDVIITSSSRDVISDLDGR